VFPPLGQVRRTDTGSGATLTVGPKRESPTNARPEKPLASSREPSKSTRSKTQQMYGKSRHPGDVLSQRLPSNDRGRSSELHMTA
jgi:hypothetical protein